MKPFANPLLRPVMGLPDVPLPFASLVVLTVSATSAEQLRIEVFGSTDNGINLRQVVRKPRCLF